MISKRKEMKLRKAAVKQSLAELGQLNAALTASYQFQLRIRSRGHGRVHL